MDNSVITSFSWTNFYIELANKVLEYKNDRTKFVQLVRTAYEAAGIEYKFYWNDHYFEDMDPFTFFGSFNKQLSEKTRIDLLTQYKKEFGIEANVPQDFIGIPVLSPMKAWFMDDTPGERMETYWSLMEKAINYADNGIVSDVPDLFDKAASYQGTSWNLTMALYWIRPFSYINLDTTNRNKLMDEGLFDGNYPSGQEYIELCESLKRNLDTDDFPYSSFPEFSAQAWGAKKTDGITDNEWKKWIIPLVKALQDMGGSADAKNARKKVLEMQTVDVTHMAKREINKISNEIIKAKNTLSEAGYIDKKSKWMWSLTDKSKDVVLDDAFINALLSDSSALVEKDNALIDDKNDKRRYWIYAPGHGGDKWETFSSQGVMGIGWSEIGDLSKYKSREEMKAAMKINIDAEKSYIMDSLATWQFVHEIKPGDVIFAKKGLHKIVGRGIVLSEYEYIPGENDDYCNYRKVKWTHKGEWDHPGQAVMKTLTDITRYTEYIENLNSILEIDDDIEDVIDTDLKVYDDKQFLREVYMEEEDYYNLVDLIKYKKNVILQGAPGVGKTFAAERLAFSMIGVVDKSKVQMVQFHQSYSYEDFIEGLRPNKSGGFDIKPGVFRKFCDKARDDEGNDYFFIIDEINRGNLSKIFGELFMLIENDKRGHELQLLYSGDSFSVPENVYIIGMMNTADRSLAMLDYALRRRFVFFDMKPGFDTVGFKKYSDGLKNDKFNSLIRCVKDLNEEIKNDDTLKEGFCIGHSYFCVKGAISDKTLENIVRYEIIPLIKEYWFDNGKMVEKWSENLCRSIGIYQ